jgi:outer membrane protein assembly factor BamB
VLCTAAGRTDVVVAGTGKLKGYDPATGQEIWTCNTLLRTVMTTPVVHDGVIYVAVQSYGDSGRLLKHALMDWLDTNQDGKMARSEVPPEFLDKFDASDKNKDGFLTGDEMDTAFQSPTNMVGGGNTVQAVRGGGTGDVTATHLVWNNTKTKAPSNLSSPLFVGGRLYVVKKGGLASCFDAASGKPLWELQRIRNFGDYYASPVAGDGKVYIIGENGFVTVLKDGPKVEILARNDMGAPCHATPAIADGKLFVRTREVLYCIGGKE